MGQSATQGFLRSRSQSHTPFTRQLKLQHNPMNPIATRNRLIEFRGRINGSTISANEMTTPIAPILNVRVLARDMVDPHDGSRSLRGVGVSPARSCNPLANGSDVVS
jgi:hypothetical protein